MPSKQTGLTLPEILLICLLYMVAGGAIGWTWGYQYAEEHAP